MTTAFWDIPSTTNLQKISSRRWCLIGSRLVKNLNFSYKKAYFSVIVNISVKTWWCHAIDTTFAFFYIFHFFQIIMVSDFLAWHDQYFIMFKDSNVFEFTSFPFKTKHSNTVVYSINSNYLSSRGKQEKNCWNNSLIKSTIYLSIFCQNWMIFKGSPNSLKGSYFTGELSPNSSVN